MTSSLSTYAFNTAYVLLFHSPTSLESGSTSILSLFVLSLLLLFIPPLSMSVHSQKGWLFCYTLTLLSDSMSLLSSQLITLQVTLYIKLHIISTMLQFHDNKYSEPVHSLPVPTTLISSFKHINYYVLSLLLIR